MIEPEDEGPALGTFTVAEVTGGVEYDERRRTMSGTPTAGRTTVPPAVPTAAVHSAPRSRREWRRLGNVPVIEIERVQKACGPVVAVDDVSLTVEPGEILGVLGPDGAGRTTLVECVTGLRTPDAGSVRVLGLHPRTERDRVRERVGVQLQSGALPATIKVREALALYASFHARRADIPELIAALDRAELPGRYFGRTEAAAVALALIGNPEVAVLDELTTGLDPQARRETWQFIERVRPRRDCPGRSRAGSCP